MSNRAKPILPALSEAQIEELKARLDGLIDRSGGPSACWPYAPPGRGSYVRGYPVINATRGKGARMVKLHRLVFELETGESPPSVDHLCHDSSECRAADDCPHRRCCNPAHLGASTIGHNARRAKEGVTRHEGVCGSGRHPSTPDNVYESPKGERKCRPCEAERARERRAKAKKSSPAPPRAYRPRGMSKNQLVDWATSHNGGDGCWSWHGASPDTQGYVNVRYAGKMTAAHALVYEVERGPIPPGYVIDHTCHDPKTCKGGFSCPHRACVNPDHLEAVPRGANSAASRSVRSRPTHCRQGHEFTEKNTYVSNVGRRACKECRRQRLAERHQAEAVRRREVQEREGRVDGRKRVDGRCANGHVVAEVGLYKDGACSECRREKDRRRRQQAGAGGRRP